ncbi:MAG TPA: hypothetical protein VMX55_02865 [candidate division Zixibacteria bacterium]|nr:hypothetical protein [candidate division Zixibacteria bacterium]
MVEEQETNNVKEELVDLPSIPEIARKRTPRKNAIIISSILVPFSFVLALAFGFIFNNTYLNDKGVGKTGVFHWLPGNFVVEFIIMWFFPLIMILLIILFIRFLSVFYIRLHKVIKFGNYNYSLVEMENSLTTIPQASSRVIVPLLLSFTVGYWFSTWFPLSSDSILLTFQFFLYALMLSPFTVILITPLWLLDDAGVISIRKRKEGQRKLPDIEGPSNYFVNLLTGSAYSLAIITIITVIIKIVQNNSEALIGALVYIIVMFAIHWLSLIYLFEVFILKLKDKLIEKLPEKLVDKNPKVLTDQKTVAKLKSIDAILSED